MYRIMHKSKYGVFSCMRSRLDLFDARYELLTMARELLNPTDFINHVLEYNQTLVYQGSNKGIIGKL